MTTECPKRELLAMGRDRSFVGDDVCHCQCTSRRWMSSELWTLVLHTAWILASFHSSSRRQLLHSSVRNEGWAVIRPFGAATIIGVRSQVFDVIHMYVSARNA